MYSKVMLVFSLIFFALSFFKPLALGMAIIMLVIFFSLKSDEEKEALEEKHRKEIAALQQKSRESKEHDSSFYELLYLKRQLIIERFNTFFDLGLRADDIYTIAHSPSPYEELEQYIATGTPSFEEAFLSLNRTVVNLVSSIVHPTYTTDDLQRAMLDFLDDFFKSHDTSDIFEPYTLQEENCPSDCMYLIGKINYFLLSIELLATYAEENNDEYLMAKSEELIENSRPIL